MKTQDEETTPDSAFSLLRGFVEPAPSHLQDSEPAASTTDDDEQVQPMSVACTGGSNSDTVIDLQSIPSGACETANWSYDGNASYIIHNSEAITITGAATTNNTIYVEDGLVANVTLNNAENFSLYMSYQDSNSSINLTLVGNNMINIIAFDNINITDNGNNGVLKFVSLVVVDGNLQISNTARVEINTGGNVDFCGYGVASCTGNITVSSNATLIIGSYVKQEGKINNVTNNGTITLEDDLYIAGTWSGNPPSTAHSGGGSSAVATQISPDDVTLDNTEFEYNGTYQMPTATVKVGSSTLSFGTDYRTGVIGNSTDAGTYTLFVIGLDQYVSTVTKTFEITKKPLVLNNSSINESPYYNGKQHLLNVNDYTYSLNGIEGSDDVDVDMSDVFFGYYDGYAFGNDLTNVTNQYTIFPLPNYGNFRKLCDPASANFNATDCTNLDNDTYSANPDFSNLLIGLSKDNYSLSYTGFINQGTIEVAAAPISVNIDDVEISESDATLPANSTLTYVLNALAPGDTVADNVLSGSVKIDTTNGGCTALTSLPASAGVYTGCVITDTPFTFSTNYRYVSNYSGDVRILSANELTARSYLTDSATGITVRCSDGKWICTDLPLGTHIVVNEKHNPSDPDHAALLDEIEAVDSATNYGADLAWKFNKLYDIHLVDSLGALYPAAAAGLSNDVNVRIPQTIDQERAAQQFGFVHKHGSSSFDTMGSYFNNREIEFDTDKFSLFGVVFTATVSSSGDGGLPGGLPGDGLVGDGSILDALDPATAANLAQTGVSLNFALLALFMLFCAAGAVRRRQMRH